MDTKILGAVVAIMLVLGGGYWYMQSTAAPASPTAMDTQLAGETSAVDASTVVPGTYTLVASESIVRWAAQKPLIEGYINSGTIGLTNGSITVTDTATGEFTIDMNTLAVGLTAKKPGKESALEAHLKKSDFFDVEKYPTATFVISGVSPQGDAATTNRYDVTGELTMKGTTNTVQFPATIAMENGMLHADATFSIDRTKWGITLGSANFFQNLADNVIDDMVQLTLEIVAQPSRQ
jgi:polyisoprenoid-binding protein YceI